jgi:alkylation response protein AidB-like acyl-CoA dehydrogenase
MVDIDTFRRQARQWITANLDFVGVARTGNDQLEDRSPEQIARARALQRRLFDGGYAGISFPRQYGGRGLSAAHEQVFREESADYAVPNFGGAGNVTFGPIARSMTAHADATFLQRHLPAILSGEEIWCQLYSEPDAGSDLPGIRTTAVHDGTGWRLSGAKVWSTGAYYADWAMCLARTDWNIAKRRGLTWFAVPMDAPGLTVRRILQIDGSEGFCEEFLDDVVVPGDAVIGGVNDGWAVAQTMLVYERGAGTEFVSAVEPQQLAPDLVALAVQAGRVDEPLVRQAIARGQAQDFARYHLGKRIAEQLMSSPNPQPAVAAYGKLAMGVFAADRGRAVVEIAGTDALTWSAGSEIPAPAREFLNARMTCIAAGTNEMQRNAIGERVLGLPREPSFDLAKPFSDVIRDARTWDGRIC